MSNTLKFYEKEVFGTTQIRPSNEASAQAIHFLQGVVVTDAHLQALKEMGFDIILNTANFETIKL